VDSTAVGAGIESPGTEPSAEDRHFATAFVRFVESMNRLAAAPQPAMTPLGVVVSEHLGADLARVDPVTEQYRDHQVVDLDRAVNRLDAENGGHLVGISGTDRMSVDSFVGFLTGSYQAFDVGSVNYLRMADGPESETTVVGFGASLLRFEDQPLAVMRRSGNARYGRELYTVEVLCPDAEVARRYLDRIGELMAADSILRGQVLSFVPNDFDHHGVGSGITFHHRPAVPAEAVVLPDGVLDRVVGHVVGIGEERKALRAAGQHLKRGVLLYGPPGTGKTHVVRHLLTRTPETTVVLLSGRTLGLLTVATKLARAHQPALVVLEDCDLVAEDRSVEDDSTMLFETLEALDGLDGDADVAFLLTTNRPDLLERALTERPGRVDLAVHIDRPDLLGRRRLLDLYARGLDLPSEVLDEAAEQSAGATASFTKELVRRTVLLAAQAERVPAADDLRTALAAITSDAETFTRTLLGGGTTGGHRYDLLGFDADADAEDDLDEDFVD